MTVEGHHCNQGERLSAIEVGIKNLQEGHARNLALLEDIDRKLFKGNGSPPLLTTVDRNRQTLRMVVGFGSVLTTAVIGQIVIRIFEAISK